MNRYVALLRAINVGSRNRIGMEQLRACFVSAGLENVSSYLQTGNILFSAQETNQQRLIDLIETRIGEDTGLGIKVILRTKEQLLELEQLDPFANIGVSRSHCFVTFLREQPEQALTSAGTGSTEIALIRPRELCWWLVPDEETKYKAPLVERKGCTATTRNWNVVQALARLLELQLP